ncbi:hypothetical protein Hanom_Chr14g01266801 [Helianthus anomalus]
MDPIEKKSWVRHWSLLWFLEPGVSLQAASLSPGIEVRLAYILPSLDPIKSIAFAIGEIILGMVVDVAYVQCDNTQLLQFISSFLH